MPVPFTFTYIDIAKSITYFGTELNWEELSQRAERWNWNRGVYLALRLAKELAAADVPSYLLTRLLPTDSDSDLAELVDTAKEHVFSGMDANGEFSPNSSQMTNRSISLIGKLRFAFRSIFVSRKNLSRLYAVPEGSPWIYFYYPYRLFDVLQRHGKSQWQILTGLGEKRLADRMRKVSDWLFSE